MYYIYLGLLPVFFSINNCFCTFDYEILKTLADRAKKSNKIPTLIEFDLTVTGRAKWADGIGRQSIELLDCLKDDLVINFAHSHPENEFSSKDIPEKVKDIIVHSKKGYSNVVILEDVVADGNPTGIYSYKKMPSGNIKIAYSMFESTRIESEGARILNNDFDAVVVPDSFLVDVYKNSGVTIPIFVVPLGCYMDDLLIQSQKIIAHKPFTFGFTGAFIDRKNHIMILESFAKAFGNSSDVRLVLHGRPDEGVELIQELNFRIKELGLTNVEIIVRTLTHSEWLDFMNSLDCYVSLSKGEGYSRSPREAMALGIPCIISDNTAQKTICESGCVRAVPSRIEKPAYYTHLRKVIGTNFDVSLDDAVKALRDVYEQYPYYIEKADQGRIWVQKYTYKNLRPYYINIVKPKKVILGDANEVTPDYLMTTSSKLYKKYTELQKVGSYIEKNDEKSSSANWLSGSVESDHIDKYTLNPLGTQVSDIDIIGAYRVMLGQEISPRDFFYLKHLRNLQKWDLTNLAHHLLAIVQAQAHLKIPSLESIIDFPLKIHNGMTLFGLETDIFIAHTIANTGYWEPHVEKLIRKIIKPGDQVIDCGANIGYFTAILAECVGNTGKVLSIEGLTRVAQLLEKAKNENNWHQVMICPKLLSDTADEAYFLINTINMGVGCIVSPDEAKEKLKTHPQAVIKMPTNRLDTIVTSNKFLERVDYIKIDVSGAEDLVLGGAQEILKRYKPMITLEFGPTRFRNHNNDPVSVLQKLYDMGYRFDTIQNICNQPDPRAWVIKNSRMPHELVDWIEKNELGNVDIFMTTD